MQHIHSQIGAGRSISSHLQSVQIQVFASIQLYLYIVYAAIVGEES